ncbi:nitroreductase [Muribacter muris]|uniref:Putative NAD(P)H nitroreductase n=1 Tax=Muribacter muris TaxID=67855 RepID=A0A4Y9K5J3_9PAST|nr:nitroreductase family protein [Muribacter muris]MBF0783986.1 nitroreductase family protein [Muribacter muris]MBF0827465.1 nitroreductase family protein [Muribacter muris]TFV13381.1 nitroreductase [Muribacter muris]
MDTLDFLQRRRSTKKFGELAPNAEQTKQIIQAGLRVPDHGRLKPYQFFVFEKQGLAQLAHYLEAAAVELGLGEEGVMKAQKLSRRAPMVIAVVAKITKDVPKVPAWEQMLTAGCATYAMQLAANAQGFETCWISNKWVNGSALRQALACREQDKIVALVMIGSPLDQEGITLATQPENIDGFVEFIH